MTDPMPLPDLGYATLPVPSTADFEQIVFALGSVPGCGPHPNQLGNMQGVYRIDGDGQGGYTLTYPAAANTTDVQAVIAAHS